MSTTAQPTETDPWFKSNTPEVLHESLLTLIGEGEEPKSVIIGLFEAMQTSGTTCWTS